jgi:hypothetical protein
MSDEEQDSEAGGVSINWRRAVKWVAGIMGGIGLVVGWYLVSQLFGLLNTVVVTLALGLGIGLLPGVWYVLGAELPRGLRGVVARITWTLASLIHGPYVMYYRQDGRVELLPADPADNRVRVDGEWRRLDPDGNWSRLGKTEFGVSYEKTEAAFDGTAVERETAVGDGGTDAMGTRGGEPVATRHHSTARNLVIDISRVCARFRGAAGGAVADAAKMDGLRDHGGGGDFGAKWIVIGILGALFLGAISGWVMFA